MKILVFTVLISISFSLKAQNYWSFDSCLNYALEHNIQIKIQKSTSRIDKINYRQSYFNFLPSVQANAGQNYNGGKSVNTADYTYTNQNYQSGSMGIGGSLTLFNGFQDINTIIKSKYDLLAGYLNIDKIKIDVTINVLNSFLNILYLEDLTDNARNQFETSIVQTEKTKLLMDLGKSSYKDLLEIRAQEAIERETLITAENDLSKAHLILAQYMSFDSISALHIQKNKAFVIDTSIIGEPFYDIYNAAQERLPDLKIAYTQLQSSKKDLAIVRGQRMPNLYMSGSYSSWYSDLSQNPRSTTTDPLKYPYRDQLKDNIFSQISLNLSIPIFNRFYLQNNISKTKVNVEISKSKFEQTKQALYKTIQQLYADAKTARAKYSSKHETYSSMEELYQYSQQQYQQGMISSIDYKISKNNMTKAYTNLLQAKYELIYKTKVLTFFTTGKIKM